MEIKYSHILKNQPIYNFGVIGHVASGKSTLVRSITGIKTQKHSSEQVRNITINIGYANSKIYVDKEGQFITCESNDNYDDDENLDLISHISFVDVPGHEAYMSNMISGSAVMNSCVLVIASNENIPQPQTFEHFEAVKNIDINEFIILQNKCDLIEEDENEKVLSQINKFIKGSIAENSNIIPSSIQNDINRQEILGNLVKFSTLNNYENLKNKINENLHMTVIRSFDINKQNSDYTDLKGGVIGGSLLSGFLKVGDYIEIRPGFIKNNKFRPIYSKVLSLQSDTRQLEYAVPGGLIGVCLDIDPSLTKNNGMLGQTIGKINKLPDVSKEIYVEYFFINRIDKLDEKFKNNETILINVNSMNINAKITKASKKKNYLILDLDKAVCMYENQKIAIFKMISGRWILLANGTFKEGIPLEKDESEKDLINNLNIDNYNINLINDFKNIKVNDMNRYEDLLKNVSFKKNIRKVYIPQPIVKKVNKDSIFSNYNDFISFLNEDSDTVKFDSLFFDYIKQETSASCEIVKSGLSIRGVFRVANIQNIIKNFMNKFKKCNTCNSYRSYLKRSNRMLVKCCLDCRSEFNIS